MSADLEAQGLALAARAAVASLAALPRECADGSIVAIGDSITANASSFDTRANGSDTWLAKGVFTMLVAHAGGQLRPVRIAGWPYTGTGISATGWGELIVVNGGAGYSEATIATVQEGVGVTGATVALMIAGGVITGATVINAGSGYLGQSPIITVTDPAGTGAGALILAQTAKAAEFAAGGIGSDQALGYLPRILNGGSPVARNALLLIGTNDCARGLSLAQSKANALALCRALVAGGVRVFAVAPLHRDQTAGVNPQRQAAALRRWYLDQLATLVPGVVVLDPTPWLFDPATGASLAGWLADGLHPTSLGADGIARALWTQMAPFFVAGYRPTVLTRTFDAYDATFQPDGNLLPQPLVNAVGATSPAAGEAPWTGSRPPSLWLSRVTGGTGTGTIAASTAARDDGRPGARTVLSVDVTGAAQGETYRLSWLPQNGDGTKATLDVGGANVLQIGDTIRGAVDELRMRGVTGLRALKLRVVAANTNAIAPAAATVAVPTATAAWGDAEDANYPAWDGQTLFLQTRELTIPAGTFGVTMHLDLVVNVGAARFTAELFGASLRRCGASLN